MIDRFPLTPRQTRTALDLLTGAVIVSVAFALAGLTWRIAGHAGTGAITVPSGASGSSGAADIAPAIALAPFGKAAVGEASQPTSLPLELRGVVAANPASLSTAFIAPRGQPALPYHVGESVGGATIQAVLRDRVILANAGRTEYLTFPDPNATATPTPAQGNAVTGSTPPPPVPPQAASLIQRFNATPSDGGYRIGANPPPGLSAGDVLLSVNGTALSDPNAAGAAYAAAQASGSATIQILRGGNRLTLTVPLR
ncbi:MAG: type II secretion system protein N [Sphingomonas sp.]